MSFRVWTIMFYDPIRSVISGADAASLTKEEHLRNMTRVIWKYHCILVPPAKGQHNELMFYDITHVFISDALVLPISSAES